MAGERPSPGTNWEFPAYTWENPHGCVSLLQEQIRQKRGLGLSPEHRRLRSGSRAK